MQDFVPLGTGNSRFLKSSIAEDATWEQARDLFRKGMFPTDIGPVNDAGVAQKGDSLGKTTLLKDATAALFGGDASMVPDEVLVILSKAVLSTSDGDIKLPSGDSVPGIPKLVYGSYVGNGSWPARVYTSGLPYFLIVCGTGGSNDDTQGSVLAVCRNAKSVRSMAGPSTVGLEINSINWTSSQVNWSNTSQNAARMLNISGKTYHYVYAV